MLSATVRNRVALAIRAELTAQHVTPTALARSSGLHVRTVKRILAAEPAYDSSVGKAATTLGWSTEQLGELLYEPDDSGSVTDGVASPRGLVSDYRRAVAFADTARTLGAPEDFVRAFTMAALDLLEAASDNGDNSVGTSPVEGLFEGGVDRGRA